MTNQAIIEACMGNCNCCHMIDNCPYESEPLSVEEYDICRSIDKHILEDRQPKPMNMTRYIHNRPDKEAYQKARDKELDHARYWRDPEKRRRRSLEWYYANRDRVLNRSKAYYQDNKDERKVKSAAYYKAHKEEINNKRREKRLEMKELWSKVMKQTFNMDDGSTHELLVIKQKSIQYEDIHTEYQISRVVDLDSTPTAVTKSGVTFPYKHVYSKIDMTNNSVLSSRFVSLVFIKDNHPWFLE